jgi:hypothetical protein
MTQAAPRACHGRTAARSVFPWAAFSTTLVASRRAADTFDSARDLRAACHRYLGCVSGSCRTADCSASIRSQRSKGKPCLEMCPSRCPPPPECLNTTLFVRFGFPAHPHRPSQRLVKALRFLQHATPRRSPPRLSLPPTSRFADRSDENHNLKLTTSCSAPSPEPWSSSNTVYPETGADPFMKSRGARTGGAGRCAKRIILRNRRTLHSREILPSAAQPFALGCT